MPLEEITVSVDKEPLATEDYRGRFYSQYHRALNLVPAPPSESQRERSVRQFGGRWDKWLPRDKSARCLDIGCGTGDFLYFLKQRGFRNLTGVDLSAEELNVARMLGAEDVRQESALDYLRSVPPGSLDLVSAFNFFEHLTKIEILDLLPNIYAALAPGGRLIAITPNGLSPFAGATRYWDFSHETGFTPASWRQLGRIAGFSTMTFEEYGPLPHSLFGVMRTAAWRTLTLGLLAVSYVEVGGPRDPSKVMTADMKIILER
ncbi:MAG: Methyltransferase type 12 [Myxococcaceae bacterium]|nr:Methyltransferase type 12 [Myxococcaceae bacterium]